MPIETWATVRVEDTGDGLIIHPDDAKKWRLITDHQYSGYFLPDGRYRIALTHAPEQTAAADTGLVERTWEQEKAAFNDWANYGEHDPINACVPVEAAKMAWLARAGREAAAREQIAALEREKALLLAVIMFAGAQGNEAETFLNCWSDGSADVDEEWHDWQEHRAALTLAKETTDGQ